MITYTTATTISNFEFWSGAKEWISKLTQDELDKLEDCIDGMDFHSATQLNDFIWFDTEIWMEDWLSLDPEEVAMRH